MLRELVRHLRESAQEIEILKRELRKETRLLAEAEAELARITGEQK